MYLHLFMHCLSSMAALTVDYNERTKYSGRSSQLEKPKLFDVKPFTEKYLQAFALENIQQLKQLYRSMLEIK